MSATPLVSVIIPCYRQGQYLSDALESVLAQSYPAIEIIVVNDGSDDNTDDIAKRYLNNIKYVKQSNQGLSTARNTGIETSSGEYLLFLDADDLLHTSAISMLTHTALESKRDLVVGGCKYFDICPEEPNAKVCIPETLSLFQTLIRKNIAPVHCILCRKSTIVSAGGFETSLASCEDWDLWLRIALNGATCTTIPYIGAYYRQTQGSMSTNKIRMLISRCQVLSRSFDNILSNQNFCDSIGTELISITINLRRRLIVNTHREDLISSFSRMITSLKRKGYPPKSHGIQAIISRILGFNSTDRLALNFYRIFDVEFYNYFSKFN